MSVEALAAVFHHSKVSGTAKVVLLGIANHEGDGGAWPSVATLAKYANTSARNVQKAIAQLEKLGELRRFVQAGGDHRIENHRRPNRYQVLVTCPAWCDRTSQHRDRYEVPELDLSTGVSNTTPGVAGDRGGVSLATPKPSLNHPNTKTEKKPYVSDRARAACGHEAIDGRCAVACRADFEARNAR